MSRVLFVNKVTSSHDVFSISKLIAKLKFEYEKLFEQDLRFKLVVMDYSFSMIHAVLDVLNHDTVSDYAHRVFKYSSNQVSCMNLALSI